MGGCARLGWLGTALGFGNLSRVANTSQIGFNRGTCVAPRSLGSAINAPLPLPSPGKKISAFTFPVSKVAPCSQCLLPLSSKPPGCHGLGGSLGKLQFTVFGSDAKRDGSTSPCRDVTVDRGRLVVTSRPVSERPVVFPRDSRLSLRGDAVCWLLMCGFCFHGNDGCTHVATLVTHCFSLNLKFLIRTPPYLTSQYTEHWFFAVSF